MVKNSPAMQETWVWSQGWEDPLEEGMATHSSILAWRISMDRGARRVTVHGVAKSQMWLSTAQTHTHTHTHTHTAGPTSSISHLLPLSTTINSMSWSNSIWSVHTGPLIVFHGQCVLHAIPWTPHCSFTIQRSLTFNAHKEVLHNYLLPPSFYTEVYGCGCVDYTFLK